MQLHFEPWFKTSQNWLASESFADFKLGNIEYCRKRDDSMKKLFKKFRKDKQVIPKIPEWGKIVEMLYDKNLDFLDSTVERVIYSRDKTKRYVILKSNKGFLTYRLERIYQLDEEEWSYRCSFDLTPAFWHEVGNGNKLFSLRWKML